MAKTRRFHGCGSFNLENELVFIVAGDLTTLNSKSVEFLIPSDTEPEWMSGNKSYVHPCIYDIIFIFSGPNLPENYSGGSHEIVSDGNTVYYVNTNSNVILKLECPNGLDSCSWTEMDQKLINPRFQSLAFLVDDDLTECSEA